MATTFCPACRGTKNIIGLGLMSHECKECDGVGYVKAKSDDKDEPKKPKITIKRKGRHKRNVKQTTSGIKSIQEPLVDAIKQE